MNLVWRAPAWVLLASSLVYGSSSESPTAVMAEFVGTTPCDSVPREFFGGLAPTALHCITWKLTLLTNQNSLRPCKITAAFGVPDRKNANLTAPGPKVNWEGSWDTVKGMKSNPDALVYRITAGPAKRPLAFAQISDHLLHLLSEDDSLMVGTSGWSYTFNRADRAEKPADKERVADRPAYKISPVATGQTVFGVFEGRTPCQGISRELQAESAGCLKLKWRVTLYQNADTSAPTTYKIEGTRYWQGSREGTWSMVSGSKSDPKAVVYRLAATQNEADLWLLKGDDNVLFFLDQRHEPLVGHADFSYTLNRRR